MLVCQKVPGIRILAETLPRLRRTPTFTLEGGERPVLKTGSMHFSYFSPCKKAESCQDLPNVPHLTTRKSWNYLPNPSSDSAPTSNTPGWSLGAVVWCLLTRLTTPIQIHKTVLLLQVGKEVRGQEREELNITKALQLGAHLLLHEGNMHPSPPFLSLHGLLFGPFPNGWCISHKAERLRCCYAGFSSKCGPWKHGALRNTGKYSFRLTPFLPLSDSSAPPPALLSWQEQVEENRKESTTSSPLTQNANIITLSEFCLSL